MRENGIEQEYLNCRLCSAIPMQAPRAIPVHPNVGAVILITYTILGVPYRNYSIIYTKTLF